MNAYEFLSGNSPNVTKNYNSWQSPKEKSYVYSGNRAPMLFLTEMTYSRINNVDTCNVNFKFKGGEVTYNIGVRNGDLNNMTVTTIGKGNAIFSPENAKKIVKNLSPVIAESEKEVLMKSSEVVISAGDKAGSYLGDKYKAPGREIAGDIKNFQGKNIRNYDDAMRSLNKVLANPSFKVNTADKDAVIKAWQNLNADDFGNKFASLGKTFKVADYAMKANNVKDKSIEGYKTGSWGPLVREVESWVLSGIAGSVALGIFSATLGAMLMWAGIPAIAVGLLGIIMASLIGSLIDDKFIDKLNNEIIKPAH